VERKIASNDDEREKREREGIDMRQGGKGIENHPGPEPDDVQPDKPNAPAESRNAIRRPVAPGAMSRRRIVQCNDGSNILLGQFAQTFGLVIRRFLGFFCHILPSELPIGADGCCQILWKKWRASA
jgi:hypothetical protein